MGFTGEFTAWPLGWRLVLQVCIYTGLPGAPVWGRCINLGTVQHEYIMPVKALGSLSLEAGEMPPKA